MPGIIAELERLRHINAVETTIDELEARIFELDFKPSDVDELASAEAGKKNSERRDAWLDTAYMSNQLINWNTQLAKMAAWVWTLDKTVFEPQRNLANQSKPIAREAVIIHNRTYSLDGGKPGCQGLEDAVTAESRVGRDDALGDWPPVVRMRVGDGHDDVTEWPGKAAYSDASSDPSISKSSLTRRPVGFETSAQRREAPPGIINQTQPSHLNQKYVQQMEGWAQRLEQPGLWRQKDPSSFHHHMRRVGYKIKERLEAIIDENNDRIRDCKMRVDGMAMATQWVKHYILFLILLPLIPSPPLLMFLFSRSCLKCLGSRQRAIGRPRLL